MRFSRLHAEGFTCYRGRPLDIELPETGLVLVTGPNGSGKSSIVEAAAVAMWGRTIRNSPHWTAGERCVVSAAAHLSGQVIEVTRSQTEKASKSLQWRTTRGEEVGDWRSGATTTKAQAELESVVGSFEAWRRTSVFSSVDVDALTRATDGERKRLFEEILGVSRFDDALAKLRREIDAAKVADERMERDLRSSEALADEMRARLADLASPGEVEDSGAFFERRRLAEEEAEARAAFEEAQEEHEAAVEKRRDIGSKIATLTERKRSVDKRKDQLKSGTCPLCEQALGRRVVQDLEASTRGIDAERAVLAKQLGFIERVVFEARQVQAARSELLVEIRGAMAECSREIDATKRREREAEEAIAKRLGVEVKLAELEATIARTRATSDRAKLAELEAVEKVLGLKGARASLVAGVAEAIGESASGLVRAILPGSTIKARVTPKGDVSIELRGAGGGWGYDSASGGERRRVDVAILLALSEVAHAARGQEPGTLFLDEVFDSLDRAGVDGISEAIVEVARRRPVVLISHSADLVGSLRADAAGHLKLGG